MIFITVKLINKTTHTFNLKDLVLEIRNRENRTDGVTKTYHSNYGEITEEEYNRIFLIIEKEADPY